MPTRKERARAKYRSRYGHNPPNDLALTTYMATLPAHVFTGCSDTPARSEASYDSGADYYTGSSVGGDGGGGL